MSDVKTVAKIQTTDMSQNDLAAIAAYVEEGTPGLERLDSVTLKIMTEAYLGGMSYRQISSISRLKKPVVLYIAQRFGWYEARRDYLDELGLTIRDRLLDAKIESKDFMMQISQFYKKKIGMHMQKFYETGNEDFAHKVSGKDVDQYRKAVELLHKLNDEGKNPATGRAPAVGLNLGHGVTVERHEDGSVEITPKEKAVGGVLAKLANFRREEESKKAAKKAEPEDLILEQPNNPEDR